MEKKALLTQKTKYSSKQEVLGMKIKRMLSALLSAIVVISGFSFTVFAEESLKEHFIGAIEELTGMDMINILETEIGIDPTSVDEDNIRSAYVTDYQSFKNKVDTGNYYVRIPLKSSNDVYTIIIENKKYSKIEKNFKTSEPLTEISEEELTKKFQRQINGKSAPYTREDLFNIDNIIYIKEGTDIDMYFFRKAEIKCFPHYYSFGVKEGTLADKVSNDRYYNYNYHYKYYYLDPDDDIDSLITCIDTLYEAKEEYNQWVLEEEERKKSYTVAKDGTLFNKVLRSKDEVTKGRNDLNDVLEFSFTITEDFEGEVVDRVGNVGETAKARLEYYDEGNSEHYYLLYLSGTKGEIGLWCSYSFAPWEAMNRSLNPLEFYADDRIADGQLVNAYVNKCDEKRIFLLVKFKGRKLDTLQIESIYASAGQREGWRSNFSYPHRELEKPVECFDINYKVVGDGYNTLSGNYEYRKEPVHDSDDEEEELVHEYYKSDIENNNDSDKKDDSQKDDNPKDDSKEDKTDKDTPKDEDKDVEDNKSDELDEQDKSDKSDKSNPNDSADTTNQTLQQKIDALKSYGIVKGYADGEFYPERNITRAEFTKIVALISGYSEDMLTEDDDYFNDVSKEHWANKYINFCYKYGLVNGTASGGTEISESESEPQKTKGLFSPEDNIIYQDAVKILVSALGCGEKAAEKGGYPNGYITVSKDLGIINTTYVGEEYINRGAVADAVYNALFISPDGSKTLYDKYFNK